jgi:hypothetical protein
VKFTLFAGNEVKDSKNIAQDGLPFMLLVCFAQLGEHPKDR